LDVKKEDKGEELMTGASRRNVPAAGQALLPNNHMGSRRYTTHASAEVAL